MKKIVLICVIAFSTKTAICCESECSPEKHTQLENFLFIIPLNDECIDKVIEEKIYLREGYYKFSDDTFLLFTSLYGVLYLNNISKDACGYYIPKVKTIIKNYQQNKKQFLVQPCEWDEEVDQHVAEGIEHSVEAMVGIGTAVIGAGVNPVVSAAAAAAGAICAGKAAKDFKQAWDSYHDNEQDRGGSRDQSERSETDSWERP